jgi:glycosyltransferase involved in cell wall biosynthesis
MPYSLVSIVLPVHNQADHIGPLIQPYVVALTEAARTGGWTASFEIIPVPNNCRDATEEICARLAENFPMVKPVVSQRGGWGRAVKLGLASANGDLLCFTNSARTTPSMLVQAINYAFANPATVIKANRKIRDSLSRRLGSLLYNLECRTFFDLPTWDINGTPKVFPRSCSRLLNLTCDNDLIDAEFNAICRAASYAVLEMPVLSTCRHGGKSTTSYKSALKLYWGAFELWRKMPHLAKE